MLKLIPGLKGEGKTKALIEQVTKASQVETGNVICIEHGKTLTFDIPYSVRLIQLERTYTPDFMKGFLSGMHAGNYDITHIFVDGIHKMLRNSSQQEIEAFFDWCNAFGEAEGIRFTMTLNTEAESASETVRRYF